MNIEDLRSLHISFYEDLQKNYPDNISGCFERHRDKFLIYGHYCSLLTKAQDHIQSITSTSFHDNVFKKTNFDFFITSGAREYLPGKKRIIRKTYQE